MEINQIIYCAIIVILSFTPFITRDLSFSQYFNRYSYTVDKKLIALQWQKVIVVPSENIKNGDFVSVFYNLSGDFSKLDRFGLYCKMINGEIKLFAKYSAKVSRKDNQVRAKIQMCYSRSECTFRYLKSIGKGEYYPVASSDIVNFSSMVEHEATAVHISLTGIKDQMRIMWVSGVASTPCVKYWASIGEAYTLCGITSTYNADDMCEPPATTIGFINPGYIHNVILSGLSENLTYFYQVVNDSRSNIYSFKTASSFTLNQFSFSMVVFGDLGWDYREGSLKTIKSITNYHDKSSLPSMILHIGDISYARGYAYFWEIFGNNIKEIASKIPYMVSIGNHEHLYISGSNKDPSGEYKTIYQKRGKNDSGGECSVPMVNRFIMPDNGNGLFWYSYDYGGAHIIMLCSEIPFSKGTRQYTWLMSDLEKINRTNTPWVFVTMHRPMYNTLGFEKDYVMKLLRKFIEPLLIQYKVDIFFAGHIHVYERTCFLNNGNCVLEKDLQNVWGVLHITVGSGGKLQSPIKSPINNFSIKIIYKYGFGNLEIINSTHAEWIFISSTNNKILDRLSLARDH